MQSGPGRNLDDLLLLQESLVDDLHVLVLEGLAETVVLYSEEVVFELLFDLPLALVDLNEHLALADLSKQLWEKLLGLFDQVLTDSKHGL